MDFISGIYKFVGTMFTCMISVRHCETQPKSTPPKPKPEIPFHVRPYSPKGSCIHKVKTINEKLKPKNDRPKNRRGPRQYTLTACSPYRTNPLPKKTIERIYKQYQQELHAALQDEEFRRNYEAQLLSYVSPHRYPTRYQIEKMNVKLEPLGQW